MPRPCPRPAWSELAVTYIVLRNRSLHNPYKVQICRPEILQPSIRRAAFGANGHAKHTAVNRPCCSFAPRARARSTWTRFSTNGMWLGQLIGIETGLPPRDFTTGRRFPDPSVPWVLRQVWLSDDASTSRVIQQRDARPAPSCGQTPTSGWSTCRQDRLLRQPAGVVPDERRGRCNRPQRNVIWWSTRCSSAPRASGRCSGMRQWAIDRRYGRVTTDGFARGRSSIRRCGRGVRKDADADPTGPDSSHNLLACRLCDAPWFQEDMQTAAGCRLPPVGRPVCCIHSHAAALVLAESAVNVSVAGPAVRRRLIRGHCRLRSSPAWTAIATRRRRAG